MICGPTTPVERGLFPGVPAEEYHSWDAMSASRLKILRSKTPAHLRAEMLNPREPTEALILGQAIHAAVLEPDLYRSSFCVVAPRNTKKGKEEAAAAKEAGKTALTRAQAETVEAVRHAVRSHPKIGRILDGNAELSAVWDDPDTGLLCKARFDDTCRWGRAIVDLKTTRSAMAGDFSRSAFDLGYHLQAAHYLAGANLLGIEASSFVIVAVEKDPPFAVQVFMLEPKAIELGKFELARLKEIYHDCISSGRWPGGTDRVELLRLPPWAERQTYGEKS